MNAGGSSKTNGRRSKPKATQTLKAEAVKVGETIDVTVTPVEVADGEVVESLDSKKAPTQKPQSPAPSEDAPIPATYEPVPLPELQLKEEAKPEPASKPEPAAQPAAQSAAALAKAKSQQMTVSSKPLPGNRPITPSKMQFRYSEGMPHRPIAISPVPIRQSDALPGHRPIAPGPLKEFHTGHLPGNRPIVPTNKSEETEEMIGYLD